MGSFAFSFLLHLLLAIFVSVSIGVESVPLQVAQVELLSLKDDAQNSRAVVRAETQNQAPAKMETTSHVSQPTDRTSDLASQPDTVENLITNLHGIGSQGDHVLSYLVGLIYKNRIYPYECIRLKQQGQVAVSFYIDANGEVADVKLLESSGFKQLDGAAMKTLRSLKIDKNISQIEKLLSRKYSFVFDFEITKSS